MYICLFHRTETGHSYKKYEIKMATDISITAPEAKGIRAMLSNVHRKMPFNLEFYTQPHY